MPEIFWPYAIPLAVVSALSIMTFCAPIIRTASVLMANWIINTSFVLASGIYDPWFFYIVIDTFSAWAILYQPAGRMQSVIGWTFMTQIVLHAVYAISDPRIASVSYWQALLALGFIQLLLLGGWGGGNRLRVAYRRWHLRRACVAHPQSGASLA